MSRLAASFVLGYHGCDADVARRVINGETRLIASDKDYDWLGPGIYFWESDPDRALEWALEAKSRGKVSDPAVIGAVIDLGDCLDMMARDNCDLVRDAHAMFAQEQQDAGLPIPVNKGLEGHDGELPPRRLDCAVIRFLHELLSEADGASFDSVRGLFQEGEPLYDGAGFRARNHIQIAVCKPERILGFFYPPQFLPRGAKNARR